MKMELTRNADNKVVGYKLIKEASDDVETFETVRDMYFWSLNNKVLVYDGRVSDKTTDETVELKFATKEHHQQKMDEINS